MKFHTMAAVGLIASLLLAGCGQATAQNAPSASPSASRKALASTMMPDVEGDAYAAAAAALAVLRIDYRAVGPDGVTYINRPDDNAVIASVNFASGQLVPKGTPVVLTMERSEAEVVSTLVQSAKADPSTRYEFKCSTTGSLYSDDNSSTFPAFDDVWKDKEFKAFQACDVEIAGETPSSDSGILLTPQEEAVVSEMKKNGGDVSIPSSAYADVLEACSVTPAIDWDSSRGDNHRVQAIAKEAVKMCPKAPFITDLQRIAAGIPPSAMKDGSYIVGKSIQAGTYKIQLPNGANGVSDCYWERTDATGGTIENDFITFAPQGPTVTVYDGEGFVSKECGTWRKIG